MDFWFHFQLLIGVIAQSHSAETDLVELNTKKTKKCSHRDDAELILLILGNFHEWGKTSQAFWCYQMTKISTNTWQITI
jgi:hypothetical protein